MAAKPLFPTVAAPARGRHRLVAAALLRAGAVALGQLARRLARRHPQADEGDLPLIEFHAEAGAPEGALYVDGQFVGRLPGITRL